MTQLQTAVKNFLDTWFSPPSTGRGVRTSPYIDAMKKALENDDQSRVPDLYQYRTRAEWNLNWSAWVKCTSAEAADYKRVPVLHGWHYEVRGMFLEPVSNPEMVLVPKEELNNLLCSVVGIYFLGAEKEKLLAAKIRDTLIP